MFAVPREQVVRIHASSGTTGKPTVVGYTRKDIDTWADLVARSIRASGGRAGDIVHVAYGYGLFTGGLGAHYGAERLGCTVIPMSGGQTEKQVQLIQDFRPDIIMVTPSYMLALIDEMDRQGIDPVALLARSRDLRRRAVDAGHARGDRAARRPRRRRHLRPVGGHGPGRGQRVHREPRTARWSGKTTSIPEIVDPQTGKVLPDGSPGELVFTSLTKEALPVIRYRTRDLTSLLPPTARSMRRIDKITGRSDDMLIIRGVNVFPSQIEELICKTPALAPHYLLFVDKEGHLDTLTVRVELQPGDALCRPRHRRGRTAAPHQELYRRVQPRSKWWRPTRSSASRSARPSACRRPPAQGVDRERSTACTRKR